MPMFLDDEQAMLADTVFAFLADTAPVAHMRALRDAGDATGFAPDLWRRMSEMGFTGILIDEEDGGLGLGHVEAGIVLEGIGRNLTPSPFLSTAVGAVSALGRGTRAQRERWLPGILAGKTVGAIAIDEYARHRPHMIGLRAERSGKGFRLTGAKRFVPLGHVADLVIVAARTSGADAERDGVTLFAVEKGAAGLSAAADRLADASLSARLEFDRVELDGDAAIGEVDGGRVILDHMLGALRAGAAAELLGIGAEAAERTISYLRERKQFGRPIGSFQALQHRAAHLHVELEIARAAVLKAQQLLDEGDAEAARAVAVAKGMAGMATALAVQEGVQMHGGVGMTDEYDIGLFMKRQRVLAEMFGDTDFHADQLARHSGY